MMWSEFQRGLAPEAAREFFKRGMNDQIRTLVAEMTDPLPPTPERFDRSCRQHEAAFLMCAGHPSNTSVYPDVVWEQLPSLDAADREVVNRFVLDELYADTDAVAAHRATAHFQNDLSQIGDLAERAAFVLTPVSTS